MKLNEISIHKRFDDSNKAIDDAGGHVDLKHVESIYRRAMMALTKVVHTRFKNITDQNGKHVGHLAEIDGKQIDIWKPAKLNGWIIHIRIEGPALGKAIVGALQKDGLIDSESVDRGDRFDTDYNIFIKAWK